MTTATSADRHAVNFGIRLPVSGPLATTANVKRAAQAAERLGFDSVWAHDFIAWTSTLDRTHLSCGSIELIKPDTVPIMFESLTTLAYVAGVTSTIKIGPAVLCVPYRNPVVTAKQVAQLDVLSEGRLIFGVGTGAIRKTNNQDFEVVGVPRTEKYERTREYVRVMKEIWSSPYPYFEGSFVSFPETEINPKPVQQPLPVWFGGSGPRTLAMLAELGDGWLPSWQTLDHYRARVPALRELLRENGRAAEDVVIGKECPACIARTPEEAERISRPTVETFVSGYSVKTFEDAVGASVIGSVDQVKERIEQFLDVGVTYFELKFIYSTMDELIRQLELFSSEIIAPYAGTPGRMVAGAAPR